MLLQLLHDAQEAALQLNQKQRLPVYSLWPCKCSKTYTTQADCGLARAAKPTQSKLLAQESSFAEV